jgi:hypothetical protein
MWQGYDIVWEVTDENGIPKTMTITFGKDMLRWYIKSTNISYYNFGKYISESWNLYKKQD